MRSTFTGCRGRQFESVFDPESSLTWSAFGQIGQCHPSKPSLVRVHRPRREEDLIGKLESGLQIIQKIKKIIITRAKPSTILTRVTGWDEENRGRESFILHCIFL